METVVGLLDRYGVAIVALVAVSMFAWWLNRKYLAFLEAQLAQSQKLNDSGTRAIDNFAEKLEELTTEIRRERRS